MIYTLTCNPALDYIVSVENFQMGMTNRTSHEEMLPGGKGINVSLVLGNLGLESTALGFIAGFTGEEIRRQLEKAGCRTEFFSLKEGNSRINIKLENAEGTEINSRGPKIDAQSVESLMERLGKLKKEDVLVLAGSIPASMPDSMYSDICRQLADKEIRIVVDATGDLLLKVLPWKPFLIKPNHHELGEIFGVTITGMEEVIPYAKKLQQQGARNVLVSMGGAGAVLIAEDGNVYSSPAPKGKVLNAVGAGDSMVAGFLAGYIQGGNCERAFRMGIATGSASAFSPWLAKKEDVESVLKQMETGE